MNSTFVLKKQVSAARRRGACRRGACGCAVFCRVGRGCGLRTFACALTFLLAGVLAACSAPQAMPLPSASLTVAESAEFAPARSYGEVLTAINGGVDEACARVERELRVSAQEVASSGEAGTTNEVDGEGEPNLALPTSSSAAGADLDQPASTSPSATANTARPPAYLTLSDPRGYTFLVDTGNAPGVVRIYEGEGLDPATALLELIPLAELASFDFESGGDTITALALYQETLIIQSHLKARTSDYHSADYLLAAYAAPSTMLLFFDLATPAKPAYKKTIGVSGTAQAGRQEGSWFYFEAVHPTAAPANQGDGRWNLDKPASSLPGAAPNAVDPQKAARLIHDALALRSNDAVAFVPSYYYDGARYPLAPEKIFLPASGAFDVATVYVCVDLATQSWPTAAAVFGGSATAVWQDASLYLS